MFFFFVNLGFGKWFSFNTKMWFKSHLSCNQLRLSYDWQFIFVWPLPTRIDFFIDFALFPVVNLSHFNHSGPRTQDSSAIQSFEPNIIFISTFSCFNNRARGEIKDWGLQQSSLDSTTSLRESLLNNGDLHFQTVSSKDPNLDSELQQTFSVFSKAIFLNSIDRIATINC